MTNVLLVRLSAMGDLVQGLGTAEALHRARPDWRITLLTQRPLLPLLQQFPGLQEAIAFDRRGGLAALWRARATLRARAFDVALDLQGNWKSALLARLSGAREVIGAAAAWRREPSSRCLLTRSVLIGGAPHPARVAWRLAQALVPGLPFLPPRLVASAAEVAAEVRALAALRIDARAPFRVLVGSLPHDPRALAASTLLAAAAQTDMPSLLLLGPAEAQLQPQLPVPVLRHAPGELRRLVALGQCVRDAAGMVLGPDQGAVHVLAAAGAPCTVLFGAQDPKRTAPPAARVLLSPTPPTCMPCAKRACTHAAGAVCMQFALPDGVPLAAGLPQWGAVDEQPFAQAGPGATL